MGYNLKKKNPTPIPTLYTLNQHSIVNLLYFNKRKECIWQMGWSFEN